MILYNTNIYIYTVLYLAVILLQVHLVCIKGSPIAGQPPPSLYIAKDRFTAKLRRCSVPHLNQLSPPKRGIEEWTNKLASRENQKHVCEFVNQSINQSIKQGISRDQGKMTLRQDCCHKSQKTDANTFEASPGRARPQSF